MFYISITVHFRFSRGGSSVADGGAESRSGVKVWLDCLRLCNAEGRDTPPLVDEIDVLSSCIAMKQERRCLPQLWRRVNLLFQGMKNSHPRSRTLGVQ
jgi:hypothetical protein